MQFSKNTSSGKVGITGIVIKFIIGFNDDHLFNELRGFKDVDLFKDVRGFKDVDYF